MFLWRSRVIPANWQLPIRRGSKAHIGQSPTLSSAAQFIAIGWSLVLAAIALVSVLAIVSAGSIWDLVPGNTVTPAREVVGIIRNALAVALAISIGLIAYRYAAAYWRIITVACALLPIVLLTLLSGRVQSLSIVLILLTPVSFLGRQIAAAILPHANRATWWLIGAALGLGLISIVGFTLGTLGFLSALPVWVFLYIAVGLCCIWRASGLADMKMLGQWLRSPTVLSFGERCLISIAIGVVWINFIGALTPETSTDATWQRLATSAQFARFGSISHAAPDLVVASQPSLGEIIYAVALTIGPLATAKLLHFIVGLCCVGAIFVLAERYGGAKAGVLGACIFYTMPLVDWLSQIAFLDLFLALFTLAAALAIAHSQNANLLSAIIVGLCCGFGFAVKVHYAYVIVGLMVSYGLALLWQHGLRVATRGVALASLVTLLACSPFLIRSTILLGSIPGLALGTRSIQRGDASQVAILGDLTGFGFGRSLSNLLLLPFDMTLRSYRFEINPTPSGPFGGMVGYVLLLSLLFLPLLRPRRLAVASLVGILVALLLWFFTAQYLRYALSIVALFCPLAGAACVAFARSLRTRPQRFALHSALAILLCAGVVVQLRVPMLGWDFVTGRESESSYLRSYTVCCSGYTTLELLNKEIGATRVLASGGVARVYTPTRISTLPISPAEVDIYADESTLLAQLDAGGFSHLLASRQGQEPSWDRTTVFDQAFLRRNAVLVGGDARGYLYRLLPPAQRGHVAWTVGDDLIRSVDGRASADIIDAEQGHEARVIAGTAGGSRYLFTFASRSTTTTEGSLLLRVEWRDGNGAIVGTDTERGRASVHASRADIMLLAAPAAAQTAQLTIYSEDGSVELRGLSIKKMDERVMDGDSNVGAAH